MGWNPNFNFSLRDDEITFCNLIFDKNCAEYLCEELLRIKQGGEVAPEYLVQLLSKGCFTDIGGRDSEENGDSYVYGGGTSCQSAGGWRNTECDQR